MLLPIQQIRYVNSVPHEGKVIVFATVESTTKDPKSGQEFTFGKIYYTVRQDGFEDNQDKTDMVGWRHWTLLPFIDEKPDTSVRKKEAEDNFLIRSLYKRTASLGAVAQVQVVSHRDQVYVFRLSRKNGHILVDRYILNGLTNELLPKLEVRYKRSRKKYEGNARMKIVSGKLQGVDSLDFRDANDSPFSEPCQQLTFLQNTLGRQFAVAVVPTSNKDIDRWHFFLLKRDTIKGDYVEGTAIRSDNNGEFILEDQLAIDPAEDENSRPLVRSIPGLVSRRFLLEWRHQLGKGLAATSFNIQIEQETKSGPQLLKGATKMLLTFTTNNGQLGALSFALSGDGLLSLIDAQTDALDEMREAQKKTVFLPVNHLENIRAIGLQDPLPSGQLIKMERGDGDLVVIHNKEPHGLSHFDQVSISDSRSYNGHYTVTKIDDNTFSIEKTWTKDEAGQWELIPEDEDTGLVFEGLITGVEEKDNKIIFTTALDHGLETNLDVLIKNHEALDGDFEISKLDDKSFAISTKWDSMQVINLFLEASKRKGLVYDGQGDAIQAEEISLNVPSQEKPFAHTYSCWVKPGEKMLKGKKLLIGEENGSILLFVEEGKVYFKAQLAEGYYQIHESDKMAIDVWSNYAAIIKRKTAFGALTLQLYRNGELLETHPYFEPNPNVQFPFLKEAAIQFDGKTSYANFVLTGQQYNRRDFTIEAWVYPENMAYNQAIWYKDEKRDGVLYLTHGGCLRLQMGLINNDNQFETIKIDSENDLLKNEWNHIAVICSFPKNRPNTLQWVINGVVEKTVTLIDGIPAFSEGLNILGNNPNVTRKNRHFKGRIGQFRIWKGARSIYDLTSKKSIKRPQKAKGLIIDLLNWPKYEGFVGGEGGDWPAPGEILLHSGASFTESPVQDYSVTGFPEVEAYPSYQHTPWSGTFSFGGLAPAKALQLQGSQHLKTRDKKSLNINFGTDSFTFETWIKTTKGGVLWSLTDMNEPVQVPVKRLALDSNHLIFNFGNQNDRQAIQAPVLFDDKWHFLSIRFDRTYSNSDDALATVFIDGTRYEMLIANTQKDSINSQFVLGIKDIDGLSDEYILSLYDTRFWSYQRTDTQMEAAPHFRPHGYEKGLVAYWQFEEEDATDKSSNKHQLIPHEGYKTVDCPALHLSHEDHSITGILSEVRIWNTALDPTYLKQTLFTDLNGKEYDLAGNWRLAAIWEEDRRVTDFSTFGNDGQLYGDLYLSPDSVRRRVGPTASSPKAVRYRNEDLVAVSQRAVYEEYFEYRLLDKDNDPITAKTQTEKPFAFDLRGKRSRSANDWIEHETFAPQIISELTGEAVDKNAKKSDKNYGWYKASCRFVMPDEVSLFRVMALQEIEGRWANMELRKFSLTHISDAITKVTYEDSIADLETIADETQDPNASLNAIKSYERMVETKRKRISQLDKLISDTENDENALDNQIARAKTKRDNIEVDYRNAINSYKELASNPFNYYWRIKSKKSGKFLSIPKGHYSLFTGLSRDRNSVKQRSINNGFLFDVQIEKIGNHQMRIRFGKENYYLAAEKPSISNFFSRDSVKGTKIKILIGDPDSDINIVNREIRGEAILFQAYYRSYLMSFMDSMNRANSIRNTPFRINVEDTDLALDIDRGSTAEGANCIQWTYNSPASANQLFYFQIQDASRVVTQNPNRYANKTMARKEDVVIKKWQLFIRANSSYFQLVQEKESAGASPLAAWRDERSRLTTEVNTHYSEINQLQKEYIESVIGVQTTAQALPKINSNDPYQLVSKGAYLGFVKASDHLSLYENCEGQVQLSYSDRYGRLKQSRYDVTADSQNPYFEEWIPDGPKAALELAGQSYLKPKNNILLSSEYTLEWWMECPVFENTKVEEHPQWWYALLGFENGGAFPVINHTPEVYGALSAHFDDSSRMSENNITLSLFSKKDKELENPFPIGNFIDLSKGWHHFALVKKGIGQSKEIQIFVDGTLRYSLRNTINQLIEKTETAKRNDLKKELEEYFDILDDTKLLSIHQIGGIIQGDTQYPKHRIAEFRLWTIPLDAEEIMVNSKVELSGFEPGLLVYYKMNEADGSLVRNYAQANADYDAEIMNEAKWVPFPAVIGGVSRKVTFFPTTSLQFSSRPKRANLSTYSSTSPKAFNIKHISFWVKMEYLQGDARLVSIMNDETNRFDFAFVVKDDGTMYTKSAVSTQSVQANTLFPYGRWVHFALNLEGDQQLIYMDGQEISRSPYLLLPNYDIDKKGRFEFGWLRGEMADFCVRNQALRAEEINLDYNKPINTKDKNLLIYLPFNKEGTLNQIDNVVDDNRPLIFEEGYGYLIHQAIDVPIVYPNVVSNEYSTIAVDPMTGQKNAMMRRFICMPTAGGATLLSNKRIEELQLLWIGNAQFKPTLLGYMEGAPPIPSENLTVPDNLDGYRGATAVSLDTSEDTEYNWTREQEVSAGFDLELFLGAGGDIAFNAPFLGRIKIAEFKGGFQGALSFAYTFLNSSSITASSSNTTSDQLLLTGSPEEEPKFEHLGNRFIPKNVGYALVVSGLADVYVLRLRRSKKMVSYSVQANDDLPMDINTITFLINPAYTMNGSLDGMTGTQATSQRYFRQVPEMRAKYGSLYPASYFRLNEAYNLKQQIENEDKRRAAYFDNFNSLLVDETSLDGSINNEEFDPGAISVNQDVDEVSDTNDEAIPLTQQEQIDNAEENEEALKESADKQAEIQKAEGKKRQKEIEEKIDNQDQKVNASYQLAKWQKKMEDLQIRASKRNIVNTYVWDADGGLRVESQEFSNTVEHTIGGSVSMDAALGGKVEGEIGFFAFELSAVATVSLTQTLTKTSTNSKGFSLNVDLSGVEGSGVTDHDDNPIMPGEKVDRYRFMSYYLEGSTKNFQDFFNDVVDPEWLMSNDEEARALRQTQAGAANKAWRILHRVTYVERPALKGFGKGVRPQYKLSSPVSDPTELILTRLKEIEKAVLEGSGDNEALRKEVVELISLLGND